MYIPNRERRQATQRRRALRRMEVVAGVIERDGMILIGQRHHTDSHPLKWEFPGGKLEPGESSAMALQRELEEELCIQARIGPLIDSYEFQSGPRPPILLFFHHVSEFSGEPENQVFEQLRWEPLGNLPAYDFVDGDIAFVRRFANGEYEVPGH